MKKIYSLLMVVGFIGLMSCEKQLELEPFDALDAAQAFETNSDFTNAVRGAYAALRSGNYYGGEFYLLPEVISDNLILCSLGRTSYSNYFLLNMNGNTAWFGIWRAANIVILRTNYILENIDKLEDGDFKDNIQGQALALRAMAHFDLARVYAKAPQFASASDLGIAYVTSTDAGLKPGRLSVAESFSKIEADFLAAVDLISDESDRGFLNKASVYGLLSRFYLYSGNDAKTIEMADNAIAIGSPSVGSLAEFPLIWTDQTESGVLFKAINTNLDRIGVGVVYNQSSSTGIRSEYVPDFELYTQYSANDVRRNSYFQTSSFSGVSFNHIIKYLQRPGSNQAVVDMKILRWAEVYLNKAEAHANLNQDADALSALDEVRSNRYTGFVSGNETGNSLDDAIAVERRLELAFEGHRLFDLKRKGLPINRSANGDAADGSGVATPASKLTLPANSPLFQMPIPQEELNANENMQPNPSNG